MNAFKRWFTFGNVFSALAVLGILGALGYGLYREYGVRGQVILLLGEEVHQLRKGAPLKLGGEVSGAVIGRVLEIEPAGNKVRVSIELTCNRQTAAQVCRTSTEFSIARFVNSELQWKDTQTMLHGSYVVAELGSPDKEAEFSFLLRPEPPRDSRISWESSRISVVWPQVYGLSYGAPVFADGIQVGCVDGLKVTPNGIDVRLAYFGRPENSRNYSTKGAQFFIKRFEGTNLEVRGVETLVKGTHVVIVPGDPQAEILNNFAGSPHSPPDSRVRFNSLRCEVEFENTFGLQVGAQIQAEGRVVGMVEDILPCEIGSSVQCAFFENTKRLSVSDTRFYVTRFTTERLEVRGVEASLRGPQLIVVPGASQELSKKHQGSLELPPSHLVRADSPRIQVLWQDIQGLEARAPVLLNGYLIGEVEKISPANAGEPCKVELVFFEQDARYRASSNRFYVNLASISIRGIHGQPSTVLKGPHVDLILDPIGKRDEATKFVGMEGAPPKNLPKAGEANLVLESQVWIDPDTPLISRRQILGYVLKTDRARDNRSYFVSARIYPEGQDLVKSTSVFFLPPKVRATLFSRDGWALKGPRVEVPDLHSFLQAGIEFRTPPEGGERMNFAAIPKFPLHLEPEPAWLVWQDAPAPSVHRVRLPVVVSAQLSWKRRSIGFSTTRTGIAVPIGNQLIGPKELLVPDLNPDEAETALSRCESTINGAVVDRAGVSVSLLENGLAKVQFGADPTWEVNPKDAAVPPAGPTNLVLVGLDQQLTIDQRRLVAGTNVWKIEGVDVPSVFHGAAAVVADETNPQFGKVVGIVSVSGKQAQILWIPK